MQLGQQEQDILAKLLHMWIERDKNLKMHESLRKIKAKVVGGSYRSWDIAIREHQRVLSQVEKGEIDRVDRDIMIMALKDEITLVPTDKQAVIDNFNLLIRQLEAL